MDVYEFGIMPSLAKGRVLKPGFFNRPTLTVACELLGKILCRRVEGKYLRLLVREVEAYDGFEDKASHAYRGLTPRNAIMFGPAGFWYVYLCYGVHWLLNIVTGPEGYPAAILLRGAGEINGPGRLTKALRIDKTLDTKPTAPESGLWIEENGVELSEKAVQRAPRIGIAYAGPIWTRKPYRLIWKGEV